MDSLVLVSDAGGGLGEHRVDVVDRRHLDDYHLDNDDHDDIDDQDNIWDTSW